ncbi:MAG: hypothetical protein LAT57_00060 [Balneolales bacterium]|nr:hypothetical protein [Balneolales bacterium]
MAQIPSQEEQQQIIDDIRAFIQNVNKTLKSQGEDTVEVPKAPNETANSYLVAGGVLLAAGVGYLILK